MIISELINAWNLDPITKVHVKSWIIPVAIIAIIAISFWVMGMHDHQFMSPDHAFFTIPDAPHGSASIFGSDGFHFRNE